MGANLCCFRPSSPKQRPREIINSATGFNELKKENNTEREGSSTRGLLASPGRKSPQCIIKPLPIKKIYLSSPELHTEFFTPTNNFCSPGASGKVWKVNEEEDDDEEKFSVSSQNRMNQSGKLEKRVSFKRPEEADIIVFYSPVRTLEE